MARDFSPEEMTRMQQEAMRRVQDMQARAQRTLQNTNGPGNGATRQQGQAGSRRPAAPIPKEMEERIRQNDAPHPQQNGPKHTRLPVELPRNITTQTGIPRQERQEPREHEPRPEPVSEVKNVSEQGHAHAGKGAGQNTPSRPSQPQRMQGPAQRGSMQPRNGLSRPGSQPKASGGLATLFGGGSDLLKRLMADQDLLLVLGMVWLLSDEEADQSLIMALLYIIM